MSIVGLIELGPSSPLNKADGPPGLHAQWRERFGLALFEIVKRWHGGRFDTVDLYKYSSVLVSDSQSTISSLETSIPSSKH